MLFQRPKRDSGVYMRGSLSAFLGSLAFLEVMVKIGMKHISGSIPESFSSLNHLTSKLVLEVN